MAYLLHILSILKERVLWAKALILSHKRLSIIGGLVLVALIGGSVFFGNGGPVDVPDRHIAQVTVRRVSDLGESNYLPVIGTVRASSEALLRTEIPGNVTRVYTAVGNTIGAGAIIAEIENAAQRAAVVQAEGAYEQVSAVYEKILRGTRDEQLSILSINLENAKSSLASAENSAQSALFSAYATVDDAILRKADQTFSNPRTDKPQFNLSTAQSQLAIDLNNTRPEIEQILKAQDARKLNQDNLPLGDELALTQSELENVAKFLDLLVAALNKAFTTTNISEDDIDAYKADAITARGAVISALSSLSSSGDTFSGKQAALEVAKKNYEQGIAGERTEDIQSAQAQQKQALGTLQLAKANLERTFIRSPIAGTLNVLNLSIGDFVAAYELAAVVSNNTGFEIQTFVSAAERARIVEGAKALIDGKYAGTVARMGSGLDPETGKIEVIVGVTDPTAVLLQGDTVQVGIAQSIQNTTIDKPIAIPLSALKILPDKTIVYTAPNGSLIGHEVTLGSLQGNTVVIESGLTSDMEIVLDARGLKEGDPVGVR